MPQAGPEGRVNTYHIWTAIFEGDDHGISQEDFTSVCCLDWKKSRNDCLISALVIIKKGFTLTHTGGRPSPETLIKSYGDSQRKFTGI